MSTMPATAATRTCGGFSSGAATTRNGRKDEEVARETPFERAADAVRDRRGRGRVAAAGRGRGVAPAGAEPQRPDDRVRIGGRLPQVPGDDEPRRSAGRRGELE